MSDLFMGFNAVRHDCELHYALSERGATQSRYACGICGGTIYLHDEQWVDLQERAARKRAAIDAIPLESPVRRSAEPAK